VSKVTDKKDFKSWISPQHGECCFSHISAYKEDGFGEIYMDVLSYSNDDYYRTWRGKLRTIWNVLRGKFRNDDYMFIDRASLDDFIKDLEEAKNFAFQEKDK